MMRAMVLATTVVMAVGCGSEVPEDNQPDQIDVVGKDDANYPQGVFNANAPRIGELSMLTLNSDNTFDHMTQGVDCLDNFGSCGHVKGTYKFSHSTTTKYIRFYDTTGVFLDRYAYKLAGAQLSVREDNTTHWDVMEKESACQVAGGSCVALVPGNCDDGAVGDATQYSCGGGLGIECCLPRPAPTGPACKKASDCSGALPDFCRVCSDGSSSCAHFSCDSGHCTIATCD